MNALKEKGIMVEGGTTGFGWQLPIFFDKSWPPRLIDTRPPPDAVFGGLLEAQLQKEGRQIPLVVEQCVQEVERRGGWFASAVGHRKPCPERARQDFRVRGYIGYRAMLRPFRRSRRGTMEVS